MARLLLTDEEWNLIAAAFPEPADTGRLRRDPRTVLDGILWVLRTGSPWRDVPEEFGAWKTCWRKFDQWNADGTLVEILHRLQAAFVAAGAIDNELWCIDGTTVRAARCTAGEQVVEKKGSGGASRPCTRPFSRRVFDENPHPL